MVFDLPQNVSDIISKLNDAGFEAYIVGGCVRDMLLDIIPFDYDITTSATPKEVKSLFEKTVDTGIRHGTVTVIAEQNSFEVTTFRTDGDYADSRHPEKVEFVSSLKEDLSRRDFTVNAMAYNNKTGLVDYFGGREDLNCKVLRTVGDPDRRFSEDALRILRLFRFSATLGFSIEEKTLESALKLCKNLKKISAERIAAELKKVVCGKNISALSPLIKSGGLEFFGIAKYDFSNIERLSGSHLKFFAFLYKASENPAVCGRMLKLSAKEIKYTEDMAALLCMDLPENAIETKQVLRKYESVFGDYLTYKEVMENIDTKHAKMLFDNIIKNKEPYNISHLAVSGDDLNAMGISGPDVGKALERLLETVIKEPQKNKREILLDLVK